MSETIDMSYDGEPAFPHKEERPDGAVWTFHGISMRDYFAAKAMHSIYMRLAGGAVVTSDKDLGYCANAAYAMADAMIKARNAQ